MMLTSWLSAGGTNLFQEIKAVSAQAEGAGVSLIKLSIGQPSGPALLSAREEAQARVLCDDEAWHEYQDNGCVPIPDFAKRFVNGHLPSPLPADGSVAYLPIPGIKPMLGLVPLSCGNRWGVVATTTNPGYPTPKVQCGYMLIPVFEPTICGANGFLFDPKELDGQNVQLVMMNYPHNPSGAIATREWLKELCQYCSTHKKRLFNDAAYGAMAFGSDSCLLSQVAPDFPDLSWAEAFSASKLLGNGTGWRVGAMAGSSDFIGDIATIKGNTDSGLVAPMAAGALCALENDPDGINKVVNDYRQRAELLCGILRDAGMQLAIEPRAGFFTLWMAPKVAFGQKVENARHFNFMMIEKTGLVGVHFDPYIRYSVAYSDVKAIAGQIRDAFARANVSY